MTLKPSKVAESDLLLQWCQTLTARCHKGFITDVAVKGGITIGFIIWKLNPCLILTADNLKLLWSECRYAKAKTFHGPAFRGRAPPKTGMVSLQNKKNQAWAVQELQVALWWETTGPPRQVLVKTPCRLVSALLPGQHLHYIKFLFRGSRFPYSPP